jgi:hypothetical protein
MKKPQTSVDGWKQLISVALGVKNLDSYIVIGLGEENIGVTTYGDFYKIFGALDYIRRNMFIEHNEIKIGCDEGFSPDRKYAAEIIKQGTYPGDISKKKRKKK